MADHRRILITGGHGQLARALVEVLEKKYKISAPPRAQLDITDREAVRRLVRQVRPDIIINTAAFTKVDTAERQRDLAFAVNARGAALVAEYSRECGARLVHFSTDYVFDGDSERPYKETDRPNPTTVYGQSKLESERLVAQVTPEALIVRVGWLYSHIGRNFATFVVQASLKSHPERIRAISDTFGCPTWTHDIARQLESVLERELSGVIHMTALPEATPHEFVLALLGELGLNTDHVLTCRANEFGSTTPRPRRSSLENARLNELGLNLMPAWRTGLAAFVARHRKDLM